jgi:hypothetical protein
MGIEGMTENVSHSITYDTVPLGEVAVRRGDHVHATDGDIGQVQGLVIEPRATRREAGIPPLYDVCYIRRSTK